MGSIRFIDSPWLSSDTEWYPPSKKSWRTFGSCVYFDAGEELLLATYRLQVFEETPASDVKIRSVTGAFTLTVPGGAYPIGEEQLPSMNKRKLLMDSPSTLLQELHDLILLSLTAAAKDTQLSEKLNGPDIYAWIPLMRSVEAHGREALPYEAGQCPDRLMAVDELLATAIHRAQKGDAPMWCGYALRALAARDRLMSSDSYELLAAHRRALMLGDRQLMDSVFEDLHYKFMRGEVPVATAIRNMEEALVDGMWPLVVAHAFPSKTTDIEDATESMAGSVVEIIRRMITDKFPAAANHVYHGAPYVEEGPEDYDADDDDDDDYDPRYDPLAGCDCEGGATMADCTCGREESEDADL